MHIILYNIKKTFDICDIKSYNSVVIKREERKSGSNSTLSFMQGGTMTSLEKKIFEELEPIINGLNISLYDVIYEKEGKDFYLRIFIEKEGGVDISDCENVNNAINDILDEKDFIKGHYYLEVSSAGLEKTLRLDKHFENNIGNKIQISLYKPINNSKNVIGILKDYDDEKVIVESDEIIEINKNDISLIKTVFDWDSI